MGSGGSKGKVLPSWSLERRLTTSSACCFQIHSLTYLVPCREPPTPMAANGVIGPWQWQWAGGGTQAHCRRNHRRNLAARGYHLAGQHPKFQLPKLHPGPPYLSASSTCCRLKSSDGTILSMCCGSQMLACSSSFTVFLTTPCRPLMPDIRILQGEWSHGAAQPLG